MSLIDWGWNQSLSNLLAPGERPARVTSVHSNLCRVSTGEAELLLPTAPAVFPAAGDWVTHSSRIDRILPRRTMVSRRQAGTATAEQVLAANIDLLLIVAGLDGDFDLCRLERTLVLAEASGAEPVFVLNKADVCPDIGAALGEVRAIAAGHAVIVASALNRVGVEAVRELLAPGVTGALIGSSGVGKSTIVNALLERDAQPVAEVRASDSRGRHTTTRRELFLLPGGGLLLDQPGLREIQLWDGSGVGAAFPDIAEHAAGCRFRDCTHTVEPGCQVRMNIDEARVANFLKMTTEADAVARKRRDKVIHRAINRMKRHGKR